MIVTATLCVVYMNERLKPMPPNSPVQFPNWRAINWLLETLDNEQLPSDYIVEIRFRIGEELCAVRGKDIDHFRRNPPIDAEDIFYVADACKIVQTAALTYDYVMGLTALR